MRASSVSWPGLNPENRCAFQERSQLFQPAQPPFVDGPRRPPQSSQFLTLSPKNRSRCLPVSRPVLRIQSILPRWGETRRKRRTGLYRLVASEAPSTRAPAKRLQAFLAEHMRSHSTHHLLKIRVRRACELSLNPDSARVSTRRKNFEELRKRYYSGNVFHSRSARIGSLKCRQIVKNQIGSLGAPCRSL